MSRDNAKKPLYFAFPVFARACNHEARSDYCSELSERLASDRGACNVGSAVTCPLLCFISREGNELLTEQDAPWDEVVLGMRATTLISDASTPVVELRAKLRGLTDTFVVLKVPVGQGLFQDTLKDEGMIFREVQLTFRSPPVAPKGPRPPSGWSVRTAEADDQALVMGWLKSGLIHADRYSIDPSMGQLVSGHRYANLILQELGRGAELRIVQRNSNRVGFFCIRDVEARPYIALSGISPHCPIPGLGFQLHSFILDDLRDKFRHPAEPVVSSANLPALRIHVHMGYQIIDAVEVYIRFPCQAKALPGQPALREG